MDDTVPIQSASSLLSEDSVEMPRDMRHHASLVKLVSDPEHGRAGGAARAGQPPGERAAVDGD